MKKLSLCLLLAVLLFDGCEDLAGGSGGEFIPVTAILWDPGSPVRLTGDAFDLGNAVVEPHSATNSTVLWSIKDPGSTGLTGIPEDQKLSSAAPGILVLTAYVERGAENGQEFSADFTVSFESAHVEAGDGSLALSWWPLAGAAFYRVYHSLADTLSDTAAYDYVQGGGALAGAVETAIDGLFNGAPYYLWILPVNTQGAIMEDGVIRATGTPLGETPVQPNNLLALNIDPGTLDPPFDPEIYEYAATITETRLTVLAVPAQGAQMVIKKVQGETETPYATGTVDMAEPGSYTIRITVTAAGQSRHYTLSVTRETSSDARLKSITVDAGRPLGAAELAQFSNFNGDTDSYAAELDWWAQNVWIKISGTVNHAGASVQGNGVTKNLAAGEKNNIVITVTAEDGVTQNMYLFAVTLKPRPPNEDASLASLAPDKGELYPPFEKDTTSYTLFLGPGVNSIAFSAALSDPLASISGDTPLERGITQDLSEITITVIAENPAVTRDYEITVRRSAEGVPVNNTLHNTDEFALWLSTQAPNTKDSAHSIKFDCDFENFVNNRSQSMSSGKYDGLGQLFELMAQYGIYVDLDLSLCAGTPLPGVSSLTTSGQYEDSRSKGAQYLAGIKLPASLTEIPAYLLYNCVNVAQPDWSAYPALAKIGSRAFQGVSWTSVTLPSHTPPVTLAGSDVFYQCPELEYLDLSGTVCSTFNLQDAGDTYSTYNYDPLVWASKLKTLKLPVVTGSLTGALQIKTLETLHIPAGLTGTFSAAIPAVRSPKTQFVLEPGNAKYAAYDYDSGTGAYRMLAAINGAEQKLVAAPSASAAVIPAEITAIGSRAFGGNTRLSSVKFHAGITSIDGAKVLGTIVSAFSGCTELVSAIDFDLMPLARVPESIFQDCVKLASISFNAATTTIGYRAFDRCASLVFTLPEGITTLEAYCFRGTGVVTLRLPSTLASVGFQAFYGSANLETVDMSAVTGPLDIASNADLFMNCTALETVLLSPALGALPRNIFANCRALTQIDLTYVTGFDGTGGQFSGSGLASVTLPPAVSSLGQGAISNCADLQWIEIQRTDGLLSLSPYGSISGAPALRFIFVPDSLYDSYIGTVEQPSSWGSVDLRGKIRRQSEKAALLQ
jgi:hypothetical protein